MLARGTLANHVRVAPGVDDIGFCGTKQLHFQGAKLNVIAVWRYC
jgi:hypothetical protein